MSWTEERLGEPSQLQRKGDPQPWPEHLQRPDFFHRPTEHRPSAINHPLLAMEQRPTEIFGQQRPSPISGKLPLIEHRPYNDHRPITIGHRPAEHLSSIINHRPLEARQMPDLIYRNEGETSFQIRAETLLAKGFETLSSRSCSAPKCDSSKQHRSWKTGGLLSLFSRNLHDNCHLAQFPIIAYT